MGVWEGEMVGSNSTACAVMVAGNSRLLALLLNSLQTLLKEWRGHNGAKGGWNLKVPWKLMVKLPEKWVSEIAGIEGSW